MRGRIPEGVGHIDCKYRNTQWGPCFVFRGAPDIIIETPSGDISGVLAIKDSATDEGSIGSGRIQIEFQMSKIKSYKANSFMPEMLSESFTWPLWQKH